MFGITLAHAAAMITVPTSTPTDFLANVTDTLADPGLLATLAVVIALPLTFWVITRIKGLAPKGR